jgi:hypothetical protein
VINDVHGHYTTAPAALNAYRGRQMALQNKPVKGALTVSDDQVRASLAGHLKQMDPLTKILSGNTLRLFPRAAAHLGAARVQ